MVTVDFEKLALEASNPYQGGKGLLALEVTMIPHAQADKDNEHRPVVWNVRKKGS